MIILSINTIELGNVVPSNEGNWDSSKEYLKYKEVKHKNKLWTATEHVIVGEEPSVSGKWMLVHDFNGITYDADSLFYSDKDGNLNSVNLETGVLKFDKVNGLHFVGEPTSTESVGVAYIHEDYSNNYGNVFIGTDDKIYSTGYASSDTVQNSRATGSSGNYIEIPIDGNKTGTWIKIIGGYYSTFALTSTGELWFVGKNYVNHSFIYGDKSLNKRYVTLTKTPLTGVIDIAMTGLVTSTTISTIAVCDDGKVFSAGFNGYGQLGIGSNATPTELKEVDVTNLNGKVIGVFGGNSHAYGVFGITTDADADNLYTAGYNAVGELGIGSAGNKNVFTKAETSGEKIVKFASSGSYSSYVTSIVLTDSGKIGVTGRSPHGNGGWGSTASKTSFQYWDCSTSFVGFTAIDSYGGTTVGWTSTGDVWKTGYSGYYLNGNGTSTQHNSPVKLQDLGVKFGSGKVIKVVSNADYAKGALLFLTDTKDVYHTGSTSTYLDGVYGDSGNFVNRVPVNDVTDICMVGDGSNCTVLAKTANGSGISWGYNGHGECGIGQVGGNVPTPTKISI